MQSGHWSASYKSTYGLDFSEGSVLCLFNINMVDCSGHYYERFVLVKQLIRHFVAKYLRLSNNSTEENCIRAYHRIEVWGSSTDNGLVKLYNVEIYATASSYSVHAIYLNHLDVANAAFTNQVYSQCIDSIMNLCTS